MATESDIAGWRNARPITRNGLWHWVYAFTGVELAREAVCCGHQAPFDAFADQCLLRPAVTLELGGRGTGKSFKAALRLHHDSRFHRNLSSRILGGSKDQSRQIYEALTQHIRDARGSLGSDAATILKLLDTAATYRNGSSVKILAASSTSVRGPHVPTLLLDEVDEIADDLRQSAIGMCMAKGGVTASLGMTSTWHKPQGPMADLIEQAKGGAFKLYTYCTFEVLERCPDSRSGIGLEKCGECPIFEWCHEDKFNDPKRLPKAKIANGHYAIDSLIQKVQTTSLRVFEADYLCKGPKADGIWFRDFDRAKHVHESAEYNPNLDVHLAIDSGNRTGAVWFQVRESGDGHDITVFGEHYADSVSAEANARAILGVGNSLCGGRREFASTDPAGSYGTAVGPSVLAEYERCGLKRLSHWPKRSIPDSLALLESFVMSADGKPHLVIHPRCTHLISAMCSYERGGKAPQWSDLPKDPQHPAEDMVDALRGGLCHKFPDGRRIKPVANKKPGSLWY